jgi:hypothetical protein
VSVYKAAEKERASTADALRNQIKEALDAFDVTQQVVNRAKAVGLEDLLAEARLAKLVEIRTQLSDFLAAFSRQQSGAGGTGVPDARRPRSRGGRQPFSPGRAT